jgi:DNA-binding GntR family transcriptional regulator
LLKVALMASFNPPPPLRERTGPHYIALRDQIATNIEMGKLSAGTKLPSERQLQTDAGTARGTVREALFQLEAEGLIYRRERSGWYVSPAAITYDPTRGSGFMRYVAEQGRRPTTRTLSKQTVPASAAISDIFRVPPGAPLYAIGRLRSIDDRAVLVETITVNPVLAPGLLEHSLDGSLMEVLAREYGATVVRNRIDMRPCALVTTVADALGVKSGTPGLLVVRTSFDAGGRVVEYDQEHWRHDAIRVHVDLRVQD